MAKKKSHNRVYIEIAVNKEVTHNGKDFRKGDVIREVVLNALEAKTLNDNPFITGCKYELKDGKNAEPAKEEVKAEDTPAEAPAQTEGDTPETPAEEVKADTEEVPQNGSEAAASDAPAEQNNTDEKLLEKLKAKADSLEIKYHPLTGAKKLLEKIQAVEPEYSA